MCRYNYPAGASIVKHFNFLEINVFIQQGCIQVIDIDSKDMLQKLHVILNILFIKTSWKKSICFPKNIKLQNGFQHW